MKEPDNHWEELQSEWQSYEPDIHKIKKKMNWETWRMKGVLMIDILLLLFYFSFLYYSLNQESQSWMMSVWNIIMGSILIYGVYFDFKVRLPIFQAKGESTKDVLLLYLKRIKAGIVIGRVGKKSCCILLILFLLLITFNYFSSLPDEKLGRWQFMLFGVCWISLFIMICHWYENKKQSEYQKLKILWKEYVE